MSGFWRSRKESNRKKALAKDLKNAQRRRRRLEHKACLLSQLDLLEVINLRRDEEVTKRTRTDDVSDERTAAGSGIDGGDGEDNED